MGLNNDDGDETEALDSCGDGESPPVCLFDFLQRFPCLGSEWECVHRQSRRDRI
jgi:hypothetical protein